MRRFNYKKILLALVDTVIFFLIYFVCSFMIRGFNFYVPSKVLVFSVLGSVLYKLFMNVVLNCYNHLWIYRNKRDLIHIVCVCIFSNICILVANLIIKYTVGNVMFFSAMLFAFAVELIYLMFSRVGISYYYEWKRTNHFLPIGNLKPTMIIGAGSAGQLVCNEILRHNKLGLNIVGFIDDDGKKIGNYVCNKKVFGPISELNTFTKKYRITNLIIACPSAKKERIREIINLINYKDMQVMIMPEISKLLSGDVVTTLRRVNIADLLGRKEVELDKSGIESFISGKCILVTGAGGSIGSELCRQIITYNPRELLIFDIYENSTYELKNEIDDYYRRHFFIEKPVIKVLIGSIRDEARLDELFSNKPDIVFHAAAHKHVPLMEDSPHEAIKNNVIGTFNVCKYADKYNVKKVVMISTDKAVNPTNVMGASKRFAEMVVEAWNLKSETSYSMVRFGNVLGSNGSAIPIFRHQIENGGPVTVTSTEITRFFMTIPEACSLVIQSGEYAKGGEKFILDMGEPVKIIDLARNMIKLSGLIPDEDIRIEITGLRPGEKLYEELLLDYDTAVKTSNEKIFVEENDCPFDLDHIESIIERIKKVWDSNEGILNLLKTVENEKKEGK